MPHAYTEDQQAARPHPASPSGRGGEQPAIGLFAEQSAWPNPQPGLSATLLPVGEEPGDEGAQLTLPSEAITAVIDELTRDRSAMSRFSRQVNLKTNFADLKAAGEASCRGKGPAARWQYLGSKGINS